VKFSHDLYVGSAFTVVDVVKDFTFISSDISNGKGWVQVDFRPSGTVCVKAYTLQHGAPKPPNGSSFVLLSWVLEGSNDENKWTEIDAVAKDRSFFNAHSSLGVGEYAKYTRVLSDKSDVFFCFVRLRQTGPACDGLGTFCLGGIEFYGNLQSI